MEPISTTTKLARNYNFAKDNLKDLIDVANGLIQTSCPCKLLITQKNLLTRALDNFQKSYQDYTNELHDEIENIKNSVIKSSTKNQLDNAVLVSVDLIMDAETCIAKLDEKIKEIENEQN